ncbi:hypothetical protein QBC32DRAFT_212226 [Pseudoneurospora amorphoporcata]|uniref:Uncharacterized protein n=1 Tax=Pseudoneurospora amorphoporcata TaxID=241081 RepID=A0AAN6NV07_9PEZI|nr:hypothetical protein QBC32DRAFT_212226 [Pseudoneurospora amorphoporcata]
MCKSGHKAATERWGRRSKLPGGGAEFGNVYVGCDVFWQPGNGSNSPCPKEATCSSDGGADRGMSSQVPVAVRQGRRSKGETDDDISDGMENAVEEICMYSRRSGTLPDRAREFHSLESVQRYHF